MNHRFSILLAMVCGLTHSVTATQNGFGDVENLVSPRLAQHVHWTQGIAEDAAVDKTVAGMLQNKLSVDDAVQIALLNNPSLQATFESFGIAQADLVQNGLLQNPVFTASVRFPDPRGRPNTEFAISQNFLDILFRPLRKKVAASGFEQAKLQTGEEVLNLAMAVREAYYTLQAGQETLTLRRAVFETTQVSIDLADRQWKAGNIGELDLAIQKGIYHQANIDLKRAEAVLLADREHLNRLMGLWGDKSHWEITDALPELPTSDPAFEGLVESALDQRLDLAAAKHETESVTRSLTLTKYGRYSTGLNIGIDTEKDVDGTRVTGPTLGFELPIFDRKQGATQRAQGLVRQSEHRQASLEADVRSQVRLAYDRLTTARQIVEYSKANILPLQEAIVGLSQQHYNFMLLGVYQLIQARQNQILAQRDYIEALRAYWLARTDLEQAVGGRLVVMGEHHGA
jgi:cobalt-zinc-cadmium efflux system outer membrane protein